VAGSDFAAIDFNRAPFLVIWEVTRACALACVHCRADAMARRDPRELTTQEGFRLGTAAATPARLAELKKAGLSRIAVSLDGPDAESHDAFRGVRGSYAWTLQIIDAAIDLGLPLQINCTISKRTLPHFNAMAALVSHFPITLWALFFLIQTGRGASLEPISSDECERLNQLYDLSLTARFGIKTTEAPHYQRVVRQRQAERLKANLPTQAVQRLRPLRAPRNVGDGNGFVFVNHLGNIFPSGFLPMPRGNVSTAALADIYRNDLIFNALRNPDALGGQCGRCRFRAVCGGSRSRAFAATGDAMASDPLCSYEPGAAIEPLVSNLQEQR
jgi:radical SAM protein with 4Fe4S-binding SPASM domain